MRTGKRARPHRTAVIALAAGLSAGLIGGCGSDDNVGVAAYTPVDPMLCGDEHAGKAVTGEGSTSQQNAIALFNQSWVQLCPGRNMEYNPTGSGAGREQFVAGHVDFAGSDSPLSPSQVIAAERRCGGNPARHLPLVVGPVALAYHLDGIDDLVLTGDVVARIFSGAITGWNDPAIAALNPATRLPALRIAPIYRSDSSGTTDNFQRYLGAVAPGSWDRGAGSEFQGGVGEGAQKSAGVVQAVQTTPGAIGYAEKGFVDHAGLPMARIDSGAGPVAVSDVAADAALKSVSFVDDGHPDDLRVDLDELYRTRTPGAYPVLLVTYEIVCSKGYRPATAAAIRSFLTVAAGQGQERLPEVGYVPLPDTIRHRLIDAVAAIG